jgi:hypothetical protein
MTASITYRRRKRPVPIETFLFEKTFAQWAGRPFLGFSPLPPGRSFGTSLACFIGTRGQILKGGSSIYAYISPGSPRKSSQKTIKEEKKDRISYRLYGRFGLAAGAGECAYGFRLRFHAAGEYRARSDFFGTINPFQELRMGPLRSEIGFLAERIFAGEIFRNLIFASGPLPT